MVRIEKIQSNFPLLKIENITIDRHTAIIGPSGAGKTTFLRCLVGVHPYQGSIFIDDERIDFKTGVDRNVSIAWQDSRLLPNYSMERNIKLGGDMSLFDELVSLLEVENLLHKMPHQLSGGEIQRANILRAVCSKAKLVLLDEPLQGIDVELINKFYGVLLNKLKKMNRIVLSVSHDTNQIYGLFDKLIVIKDGKIISYNDIG